MSAPKKLALGVEMTLFNKNFTVEIPEVGVLKLWGYLIRLPPTVSLLRWISDFCGKISHTILAYVANLNFKTASFVMKWTVSDPVGIVLLTPWASLPNSLTNYFLQADLSCVSLTISSYSICATVNGSVTKFSIFIIVSSLVGTTRRSEERRGTN